VDYFGFTYLELRLFCGALFVQSLSSGHGFREEEGFLGMTSTVEAMKVKYNKE
jgi:hypothetical protein